MDRRETVGRESEELEPTGSAASAGSPTQAFYGRWAAVYDVLAKWTPGIRSVRRSVAAACLLSEGQTVVELGCGTGANLRYLRDRVGPDGTVVGVDVTPQVIERARCETADLDNVHVVRGDATRPPLSPAGSDVDAIVATFLVGMLQEPAAAVSAWCDLVGPGGRVVLANATRTERWYAPAVNAAFRGVVLVSTPPTTKLRYDDDPVAHLDERVERAHGRLLDRSRASIESTHILGLVRLTGGIVGDPGDGR